jgi:hypothetical protein
MRPRELAVPLLKGALIFVVSGRFMTLPIDMRGSLSYTATLLQLFMTCDTSRKVAMQSVISREFQPPTLENLSMCTVVFRSSTRDAKNLLSFSVATGTRVYATIVRKATMIQGKTTPVPFVIPIQPATLVLILSFFYSRPTTSLQR